MTEDGEDKTEETKEEVEAREKREAFNEKMNTFTEDIEKVCVQYGVGMVSGIYFMEEDQSGVMAFGKTNHMEEAGLAKLIDLKITNKLM